MAKEEPGTTAGLGKGTLAATLCLVLSGTAPLEAGAGSVRPLRRLPRGFLANEILLLDRATRTPVHQIHDVGKFRHAATVLFHPAPGFLPPPPEWLGFVQTPPERRGAEDTPACRPAQSSPQMTGAP